MTDKHKKLTPPKKPGYWDGSKQEPVVEMAAAVVKSGTALDMGAGWPGRDAFYLAQQGFEVTAAEVDEECLAELHRRNTLTDRPIKIIKAGLLDYEPAQQFDLIVCDMVLHFLKDREQVDQATRNLKDWTKPGGCNVITGYTTKNPPGKRPYLFAPNELAERYSSWRLMFYKEEPTPWFHIEGEPKARRNEAVYLLAQKPV